jgi:hypothetical protein
MSQHPGKSAEPTFAIILDGLAGWKRRAAAREAFGGEGQSQQRVSADRQSGSASSMTIPYSGWG